MKNVLWLIAVLASGFIGFYAGVGQGSEIMATLVAQADVAKGLTDARTSLDALQKNDLSHSNRLHERTLESALVLIGTHPPERISHLTCTDKDRRTIQAARKYIEAKPGLLDSQMKQFTMHGLAYCAANGAG